MATDTAPRLRQFLDEAAYPLAKDALLSQARDASVPADDLAMLGRLPDQTYMTAVDVSLAIDEVDAAGASTSRKRPSTTTRSRPTGDRKTTPSMTSIPSGPQARSQATEATNRIARRIGDVTKEQFEVGKGAATSQLARVTESLRQNEQQFRTAGDTMLADLADAAATGVERTSTFLEQRDLDEIGSSVQSAVRQRPVVAIGAALAAGFVIARAVKAGIGGQSAPQQSKNQNER